MTPVAPGKPRAKKSAAKFKRPDTAHKGPNAERSNKKAEVIAMMKGANGATLPEVMEATGWQKQNPITWLCKLFSKEREMYKLSAAITLAALLAIRAFAQTPASTAADLSPIKVEGAETLGTFGAFEASVLAGLDRQVDAQKNTLAALRAKYNDAYPDVETAKLSLAILQARRDALARKNADIANMRVAALLDPGMLTRGTADSLNRAAQPAAHEALFDFSKSQTITGIITQLNLVNPYSVVTVKVPGALTNVFLASANALAAGGWSRGTVNLGDQITVTGAPARGGSNILQATEASSNGKPLFSRPAIELSQDAVGAYEK